MLSFMGPTRISAALASWRGRGSFGTRCTEKDRESCRKLVVVPGTFALLLEQLKQWLSEVSGFLIGRGFLYMKQALRGP
jgi:hypothetical protein